METQQQEIFKDIPEFPGYQASNLGRIMSFKQSSKGRILKPSMDHDGYLRLAPMKNGKTFSITVHLLVAMAWLGHRSINRRINTDHIDNNKLNNRADNLQIISARANVTKAKALNKGKSSKFAGVSWDKKRKGSWLAHIMFDKKLFHVGYFKTEIEAYSAYQTALSQINNGTFKK